MTSRMITQTEDATQPQTQHPELQGWQRMAGTWATEALIQRSAATAFQARTVSLPLAVRVVVTTSVGTFRPEANGGLVFQAHDLDEAADPREPVPVRVTAEMERRLAGILRTGRVPVRLESVPAGICALPADGFTIAGYLDQGGD
jgi:hypothetical protein